MEFDEVLREYGALIDRAAASYEANLSLRQELTQEMCLTVWQALSRFKGQSSLKTYILRVAHNKGVSHVAKEVRTPDYQPLEEEQRANPCGSATPEQQMSQRQEVVALLHAVRQMPIQSRQVITLYMEGLSYQEISAVTGLQSSNVGVILNRAKKHLLTMLQHRGKRQDSFSKDKGSKKVAYA